MNAVIRPSSKRVISGPWPFLIIGLPDPVLISLVSASDIG